MWRIKLLFLGLLLSPCLVMAQDLSLLVGETETSVSPTTGRAWQLEFREAFWRHFAASVSYVNEGHVRGHKRDGLAAQLWGRVPLFHRQVSLDFGGGPYRYFDTQAVAGGGFVNVSGWGGIFSASTTLYTKSPWFARFAVNHIYVPNNLDANTYLLGVGYHLWEERPEEPVKPGEAPETDPTKREITGDEVTFSFGQTVVNSLQDQKGFAGGIEFRKGIAEYIDWTMSWLNMGDKKVNRRNGLGMQIWLVDEYFKSRFPVGIGAGPIYFVDRRDASSGGQNPGDLAGLVTLSAAYRFSENWYARFHWDRVFTFNNTDADLFLAGIGYRFRQ
ncbi:MAG: hypothetical protein ACM3OG_10885 [Actinomycetota bacterium]